MSQSLGQNIALIGFMAVGKSAVGRKLARRLKRRFVDLDKTIEKGAGAKIRDIFLVKGEGYFRQLEKETLVNVLANDGQVISTGGGVVMDEDNLRLLQQRSLLICLRADLNTILRRAGSGKQRPLITMAGDKAKRIEELLRRREKYYAHAQIDIDTSNLTVDEVVDRIIALAG